MKPLVLLVGHTAGWREVLARRESELAELRLAEDLDQPLPRAPVGAFIELGGDPEPGLRAITRLRALAPEASIVAVAGDKEPNLILRAMRAGAAEFVLFREESQQRTALHELLGRGRHPGYARVVTVMPASGGAGATTLAVNLGIALAADGHRVALVDLDFHLGDVLLFLDLDPSFPISALLANEERMDGELLLASLPRYGERVWVAAQSGPVETRDRAYAGDIPRLLSLLRPHFDYLVLDGLRGLGEAAHRALTQTDQLLLIVTPEIPAVKHAQHTLAYLPHVGFDGERVQVIANRVQRRGAALGLDQLEEFLGRAIAVRVPDDPQAVGRAIREGRPLAADAPRTAVMREVQEIAALVSGHRQKPRAGLLQRLFNRGHAPPVLPEGVHGTA